MSWSYDPTLAAAKDHVRFKIQDTDEADQLISDEEITATLEEEGGNLFRAAAAICEKIALKLAREPSLKDIGGGLAFGAKDPSEYYMDLAKRYAQRAARSGVKPFAGGISQTDKTTRSEDAERVAPAFTKNLHDAP